MAAALFVNSSAAEAQGFVDSATSAGLRPAISAGQARTFLPARGPFTFPSPYNTQGFRLTNDTDCGGTDCVMPVGYSYWNNINNHAGSDTMLVFLGLERRKGGGGPTLFSVNKNSGETKNLGPMFTSDNSLSWATGEGWYFSRTRAHALYVYEGSRMMRYDVMSKSIETVFDVATQYPNRYIWQMHSSSDDRVHSATLRDSSSYEMLGCVAYREDMRRFDFFPKKGDFDECQIDKSGRWLVIKENLDGKNGEDNRIIDLTTGQERVLYDEKGAAGHSDIGHGYLIAEDNFNPQPGAVRVWRFDGDLSGGQPASSSGQGALVYQLATWQGGLGHLAHSNSKPGVPVEQQMACSSNANRESLPRINEIVCYRLDGSLNALVVAPNMVDMNASGGGTDDYWKLPKGNIDPTGEYFIWTANAGSGRLDAYIVRIPVNQLGSSPVATPPPSSTPTPSPSPAPAPTPAPTPAPAPNPTPTPAPSPSPTTSGELVQWTNGVNVSASGGTLQKSGGCSGCPDAGASSAQQITSGDGGVQFKVTDASTLRFVGLTAGAASHNPSEIQFALRLQGGVAEVRESGAYRSDVRFSSGDIFGIYVVGGTIQYAKNGAVFYSSQAPARYPLTIDTSFYDANAVIHDAMIVRAGGGNQAPPSAANPTPTPSSSGSSVQNVRWTNATNVSVADNSLRKTGGCHGCSDAAATAEQTITRDGGVLQFVVDDAGALRMVGLSSGGSSTPAEIEFALRVQGGVAEVRESGGYKAETRIANGSVLTIAISGGTVSYASNGQVFYTSSRQPAYPMAAGAMLFDMNSTVSNAVIRTGS
jgi:hypothetical protein